MAPLLSFKCVSATVSDRLVHIRDGDDTVTFEMDEAAMLRNWLNAVLATPEQRCPHGYTMANLQNGSDTCRGCSEMETAVEQECGCDAPYREGYECMNEFNRPGVKCRRLNRGVNHD
jgi:hypothetical protein